VQARGPAQPGAAARGGGELESTAVAFGAAAHAGQATGSGGRAETAAVVGDVKGDQPVLRGQGDADRGSAGMAGAVGQRLAGDSQDVLGQGFVRVRVQGAGEPDAGGEAELRGVLLDDIDEPGVQAGVGLAGLLKPEDAGADLPDDVVQGVGIAVEPFGGGRVGAGGMALQAHAEGEQFLDDMVVQVARDAVVIFDPGQHDLVGAGLGEFHGYGGVAGERGGHVQVCLGEPGACGRPAKQQRATDPLADCQRDDDQRAGIGAERGGCRLEAAAGDECGLAGADRLAGHRVGQRRGPVHESGGQCAADARHNHLIRFTGHSQCGEIRAGGSRGMLADQRVRLLRLAGQQHGHQLSGGVKPAAALLGLRVPPGVGDRRAGGRGERDRQLLIFRGELAAGGTLGEVEVAEDLLADADRDAEEAGHRRVSGREPR
jgi:hypothetical protein